MASARRVGTNRSILTYGAGGGYDYDTDSAETWQDWEDDTTENMSAGGTATTHVLQMAAGSYSDFVTVAGGTTDASHFRICEPIPGDEHNGDPTAGVLVTRDDGAASTYRMDEDYASLHDLRIGIDADTATAGFTMVSMWANHGLIVGIFVTSGVNIDNLGINNALRIGGGASNPCYAVDCIVTGITKTGVGATRGYYLGTSGRTVYVYNCIAEGIPVAAGLSAIDRNNGTTIAKNCIAQNNNNQDGIDGAIAQTTCYESSGAGSVLFTNAAAGDYTLQDTDTDALGQGTNLDGSAPHNESVFPFEDDIARIDWEVPWSMGAHQPAAAGNPWNYYAQMQ